MAKASKLDRKATYYRTLEVSAEYQAYSLEEYCDKIREEMLRLVEEEEVEEGGEGEGEGEDREEGGA